MTIEDADHKNYISTMYVVIAKMSIHFVTNGYLALFVQSLPLVENYNGFNLTIFFCLSLDFKVKMKTIITLRGEKNLRKQHKWCKDHLNWLERCSHFFLNRRAIPSEILVDGVFSSCTKCESPKSGALSMDMLVNIFL